MWMQFLHKFVTLKELTAEGLTDSSWNTLENIKRHHERDFLHLEHFGYNAYFWQHPAPKWIYFLIFEHYNISKDGNLWSPLVPFRGEIDICVHWLFCIEFNAQQKNFPILTSLLSNNSVQYFLNQQFLYSGVLIYYSQMFPLPEAPKIWSSIFYG